MYTSSEIQRFTYVTIVLAAIFFALMAWLFDDWAISKTWPMRLSSSITLVFFFWVYFINSGWKQKWLSWIAPRPNLSGTWVGHLESSWVPKQPVAYENVLPIVVSIHQNFFSLVVKSFTERAQGTSDLARALHKEETAETLLTYVYSLRDEFTAGAGKQQGAGVLRIVRGTHIEMTGEYWTNTKTRGRLILRHVSNKEAVSFSTVRNDTSISNWPRFA